jgi:magnesium-transporting ATPase (P-type)
VNDNSEYVVEIRGQKVKYKVLNVLEFNRDRKRMSVIIKDKYG